MGDKPGRKVPTDRLHKIQMWRAEKPPVLWKIIAWRLGITEGAVYLFMHPEKRLKWLKKKAPRE